MEGLKRVGGLLCLLAGLMFLGGAPAAWAGGALAFLEPGHWSLGAGADYLYRLHFDEYDLNRRFAGAGNDQVKKEAEFQEDVFTMADFAYGLSPRVNLMGRVGLVDGGKWLDKSLARGEQWEAKLGRALAWALGVRFRPWRLSPGGPGLLLTAWYLRYDDRSVRDWRNLSGGYAADHYWSTEDEIDYWQLDLQVLAYWPLGPAVPYAGVGYTHFRLDQEGTWRARQNGLLDVSYDSSLEGRESLTLLAGLELDLGGRLFMDLRGIFVARTQVSLGLAYRF